MKLVFLFFFLISCGSEGYFEPELEKYFNAYLDDCNKYPTCTSRHRTPVFEMSYNDNLGEYKEGKQEFVIIGMCSFRGKTLFDNRAAKIQVVHRDSPKVDNECQYKALLYHEIGHCLHGLDHDENSPIMKPVNDFTDLEVCEANWQAYIDELFITQMAK